MKASYSCLPNMGARVAGLNKDKLSEGQGTPQPNSCTCTRAPCPVGGDCKQEDVIYKAVAPTKAHGR